MTTFVWPNDFVCCASGLELFKDIGTIKVSLTCMNAYLAIDSGGNLCTSLHTLIAMQLNAFCMSRMVFGGTGLPAVSTPKDWILYSVRTCACCR